MTGSEAWEMIAPFIMPMFQLPDNAFNKSLAMDAYLTVFRALREMDERSGKKK